MPRYKPDHLGRSCLLYPCSKLQQQRHYSLLHRKSVDSLNACINLIWTHTSFVRHCHIKYTLAVSEFKYLPSNSMKMFQFFLLNVSKISAGNPGKKLEKVLNFALRKVWVIYTCYIHVLSYNSSGIIAYCTVNLLILLMHVSI